VRFSFPTTKRHVPAPTHLHLFCVLQMKVSQKCSFCTSAMRTLPLAPEPLHLSDKTYIVIADHIYYVCNPWNLRLYTFQPFFYFFHLNVLQLFKRQCLTCFPKHLSLNTYASADVTVNLQRK
jgi:hypothetical protein